IAQKTTTIKNPLLNSSSGSTTDIDRELGTLANGIRNLNGSLSNRLSKINETFSSDIKNLGMSSQKGSGSTPTGIPGLDATIAVIGGGLIAAFVTIGGNEFTRKRQDRVEVAKQKIDATSKRLPTYVQLATYHRGLYSEVNKVASGTKLDPKRCLFYVCDILQLETSMFKEGGYVLDDLDAEEIIYRLGSTIPLMISRDFHPYYASVMRSLVEGNVSYHEFCDNLLQNNEIYNKFKKWLSASRASLKRARELEESVKKSLWYSELITLELNHLYKRWYGIEPSFKKLNDELRGYLREGYKEDKSVNQTDITRKQYYNYYKRIKGFDTSTS
ncbi:MAG: hypothetical protein WAM14_22960, partial [Candidatus Nitrosopolaris sp.]